MKLGVLGGGQLGRMLALAGYPLGLTFRVLDPSPEACAGDLCEKAGGAFDDPRTIDAFVEGLDAATYEWENVPVGAARAVAERVPNFFPPVDALAAAQDRLEQKNLLKKLGIPTAPFSGVSSREELEQAAKTHGTPGVLKTRRHGYDGKGQFVVRKPGDLDAAWARLGSAPLIYEGFVPFSRELSLVAARGRDGATAFYPLVENEHRDGILRVTVAPAPASSALQPAAEDYARRLLEAWNYVGVLTIELFEHEGNLLANEVATRVHNSGHWTIDGAETSQFEQHLRAGLGLPLGTTRVREPFAMVNLIGTAPTPESVLAIPGAKLHLYGKEPRPGRKLGHINAPYSALALVRKLAP